jgi:aldehyde dehydrogenase (NAD+)
MHESASAGVRTQSIMIDVPAAAVDCHTPFSARKELSYGTQEQEKYAVEFCTTVKTA